MKLIKKTKEHREEDETVAKAVERVAKELSPDCWI
jgi:hypothetical protein